MNKSLATKLVAKNLINETTEVVARYRGSSISGDPNMVFTGIFSVVATLIGADGETISFHVQSTRDGHNRVVKYSDILEIDGMEPNRFASVYNIKADGVDAKVGKRRGRKPKDRTQQITKA